VTGESRGEAELQHQGNSFVTSDEWGEIWAGLNNLPAHRGSHTCKCRPSMVWRGEPGPVDTARMERDAEDGARCGASSALCPSERQEVRVCPSLQPHVPNAMSLSWRERKLQGPQAFPRRAQISCSQSLSQNTQRKSLFVLFKNFLIFVLLPPSLNNTNHHQFPPCPKGSTAQSRGTAPTRTHKGLKSQLRLLPPVVQSWAKDKTTCSISQREATLPVPAARPAAVCVCCRTELSWQMLASSY